MGKNHKVGLGRALVKHHNKMILESKEKGRFYRSQEKVLESVTDINDIDAVIGQADEAARLFSSDNPVPNLLVDQGSSSGVVSNITPLVEMREQQMIEEALHASSLQVPRRPPWNAKMTFEELDTNERQAFLIWRRSLARLEDNDKLVLTPFEKNLDIWRQLWRVVERSDLLVMVVDARDPLFYRCPDLEVYAREVDKHKRTLLLVNKADLLPVSVREKWAQYFRHNGILFVFWSAKAASTALEGKTLDLPEERVSEDPDTNIFLREELLSRLQSEAEAIVMMRRQSDRAPTGVMVGFVGYPNVGKSSTINALVGQKKTGVTSTPGKTKHFQTLIISEKLTLCDCPGLVFPSFTSSRYEMIASGVLPVDRMTEHREAVQVVANRVPRNVIESLYKITLPKPKPYELQSRPPHASELLRAYCASRRYVASSGLPDETRASRQILKDYIVGKLSHYEMPPGLEPEVGMETISESEEVTESGSESEFESDEGDIEEDAMLEDLKSFDLANGLVDLEKKVSDASKKRAEKAPHKQHRKPQRKKDRSWRARNQEEDGMPSVVKVFRKPANTGPVTVR
ncbi:GTPase LSG1-2-like [Impatiens glandulifera]|uniref:GTPase LSG1-2-like n=1 Tax=Impatiens glandulifera TaxID=253017 RepID=UPI001FB12CAF|nr:GTPase LSG1-2-like [Impatiens glandulifera]